jgi:hypothetical protein
VKTLRQFLTESYEEHGIVGDPDPRRDYRNHTSEPLSQEERVRARKWIKSAKNAPMRRSWWDQRRGPEVDTRDLGLTHSSAVNGTTVRMHHRAHGVADVPTHKLVASQSSVIKAHVMRHLNDRRRPPTPVATFIPHLDKYVLHGGHHRIATEVAAGRKSHKVIVVPNEPRSPRGKYNYESH